MREIRCKVYKSQNNCFNFCFRNHLQPKFSTTNSAQQIPAKKPQLDEINKKKCNKLFRTVTLDDYNYHDKNNNSNIIAVLVVVVVVLVAVVVVVVVIVIIIIIIMLLLLIIVMTLKGTIQDFFLQSLQCPVNCLKVKHVC